MLVWAIAGNIALLALLALVVITLDRYSRRFRSRGLVHAKPPIRRASLAEVDPVFSRARMRDREVLVVGGAMFAGTDTEEAWILAALAKQARALFEFGTASGRTTYLWARNSPADARVITITLGPDQLARYQMADADSDQDTAIAIDESVFETFLYSGTDVEYKVEQLLGDSKYFDDAPYREQMDVIFIDGSHAYSYVQSDTAKALRMLRPGGLVLWHDYRGPCHVAGVYRFLNELSRKLPLRWIAGTSLVCYRKPAEPAGTLATVKAA